MKLFPKIERLLASLPLHTISNERKAILQPLIDYLLHQLHEKKDIRLHFICTHNSRRSHLSQVWAQSIAYHLGLKQVFCYSGGTEATALYPLVATTLQQAGFEISTLSEGLNPVYSIKYADNEHPVIGFSKKLDAPFNPRSEFAAIMTCSQADEDCPFISGATQRIPIPYEDPKAFDNSPLQAEKYQERSLQIATELLYVFSQVQS